jgi:outer membrane protein TolC
VVAPSYSQNQIDSLHLEILSLEIQKAQLQVEETNFWHRLLPQIQFSAGFSTKDIVFLDPTNATYLLPKDSYRLSVSLSISDIFDGSKHENAKLNLTKLQLEYEQTKQRQAALRQHHQNELSTANDVQKNLEESLKLKEDILRFNELLFKQGKIEFDVLIKSKLDLLTTQNSIIQLKQQKHDLELSLPNGANNE